MPSLLQEQKINMQRLKIEYVDNRLVISIGKEYLYGAVSQAETFHPSNPYGGRIIDKELFFEDFIKALNYDINSGDHPLYTLFDDIAVDLFASGSLAFGDNDE